MADKLDAITVDGTLNHIQWVEFTGSMVSEWTELVLYVRVGKSLPSKSAKAYFL